MFCEAMNLIICILSISAVATLAAPLLARTAVAAGGLVPNKVQDSACKPQCVHGHTLLTMIRKTLTLQLDTLSDLHEFDS
ncbi:unnamed protein product [Zymoseptoria tritici ST99CH_3D7]|uniref:Secreted protein n=1 Tax=Zymoseptoria tritici (strain ST99CH_3D7) TaxID=1276538 RepID=A0A1X7RRG3_ZYMT9|nr:unnamed protein product [Zymoseptoria tritici ST99CH_3D7]